MDSRKLRKAGYWEQGPFWAMTGLKGPLCARAVELGRSVCPNRRRRLRSSRPSGNPHIRKHCPLERVGIAGSELRRGVDIRSAYAYCRRNSQSGRENCGPNSSRPVDDCFTWSVACDLHGPSSPPIGHALPQDIIFCLSQAMPCRRRWLCCHGRAIWHV